MMACLIVSGHCNSGIRLDRAGSEPINSNDINLGTHPNVWVLSALMVA
jgi:hypothetical protein